MYKKLNDPNGKFPHTFPPMDVVKELMEKNGLNKNDHIVLYGQPNSVIGPTRAYFVLETYGCPNLKILDGGLKKYVADHLPTIPGELYHGERTIVDDLVYNDKNIVDYKFVHDFALGKL